MGSEAVNSTLGEVFAAEFASLGVPARGIGQYACYINQVTRTETLRPKGQISNLGGGPSGRSQGEAAVVLAHLLELSASLGPRWKYCWITWLGRRPMAVIAYQDRLGSA
jgi:hypothetical protein